jgi:nitrite reductase/ring-hydroxylating ferredoxin subunit
MAVGASQERAAKGVFYAMEETSLSDLTQYGNKSFVRAAVGTQFDYEQSYADILEADEGPKTPHLLTPGTHQPWTKALPYELYYDPKYVPMEIEKIWKKTWHVACRGEDIPEVGDRISYDVGPLSFLIVRSGPDEFKAFYNSCRHRGRRLCRDVKESGDIIQCPFHAWAFGLDGKLMWVPRQEEFPGVTEKNFSLREVQCDTWGGNVFINPDPNAPPLKDVLGPIAEHFKDCPQEDRYTAVRILKKVRINWKSGLEAFLEGYHVLTTHPSGMPMFGSTYTTIDCWDDGVSHVSRLITPAVVADAWVKDKVSPSLGLNLFCNAYGYKTPPADRGTTMTDARAFAAEATAEHIKETTGIDFSDRSVAYLIDMVQWFSFPNFFPWWGEGLAWWYNFTPLGDDPNSCVMEIRLTMPVPRDRPCPPSAAPVDIDFDDQGRNHPETGAVGYIMDEDMENMEEVHRGMRAARDDSARPVLSKIQEARIRHFHETYSKAMGLSL